GELYKVCIDLLWATIYKDKMDDAESDSTDPETVQMRKIIKSVGWAQDNFASYPLLLFAFDRNDSSGGSIFPAIWSAMLAARAEDVGSSLTSVLAFKNSETFEILGVPEDKGWKMAACIPMGYPTGTWGVAKRDPVHEVAYRNTWGEDIGYRVGLDPSHRSGGVQRFTDIHAAESTTARPDEQKSGGSAERSAVP
ncbi:MAG: hypothetical protein EBZ17_03510, partial [Actinobacteria bacterium]|nr:hypothetical protein [Actinomycetota bacterium]